MSFQIKYFTYDCVREKVAVKVLNIFGKRPILGFNHMYCIPNFFNMKVENMT